MFAVMLELLPPIRSVTTRVRRREKLVPSLLVVRELTISSLLSNAVAFAVAGLYGWGDSFANSSTRSNLEGFTLCMVWNCTFFGSLVSGLLLSFILRGRPDIQQRSMWSCFWLTLRLSTRHILVCSLLSVGFFTTVLFQLNVPVIKSNLHTFICFIAVLTSSVLTSIRIVRSMRGNIKRRVAVVRPVTIPQQPPSPSASSWRGMAARWCCVVVPTTMACGIDAEYVSLARRVKLLTPLSMLLFCVGTTIINIALPMMVKSLILRSKTRNLRNTFYTLVGAIMHFEIQIRMAVRKAGANSISIYKTSALINVAEVLVRLGVVGVELTAVRKAKRKMEAQKQQIVNNATKDQSSDPQELQGVLVKLEISHDKWKKHHLRLCAIEIYAEMASEYCSIGLVSIFMLVLQWNDSVDVPVSHASTAVDLYFEQLSAWAAQVAFEIVADTIATAIEIHAGIPLLEILREDRDHFMHWVVVVVSTHAAGVCIAGLISFGSEP